MSKTYENKKIFTELRSVLEKSSLFHTIDFDTIEYLLTDCQVLYLKEGDLLLSKNQHNDNVYIIISGSVSINLIQPNELAIALLSEGECLGEMSIIDGRETSASVIAATDSSILQIPKDILWSMINASPRMAQNLLHILSQRIRSDNEMIVKDFYTQREIEQVAQSDTLTKLHNRRWFENAFMRQIKRCNEDSTPLCLLMLDIDYFKRINDTYGHIAGDSTLVAVANVFANQLRPMDMLARYGGDEFILGLYNAKLDESFSIAERLRRAIEFLILPFRSGDPLPHVTISIGIEQMKTGQTLEEMVVAADAALYRAKDGGRNRVVL